MATMFGATCHNEVNKYITHVVTAKVRYLPSFFTWLQLNIEFNSLCLQPGTAKVDQARRRGGIYIVWLSWFTDSIALWQRQPEEPYLLEGPPSMPSTTTPPDTPTKDPMISSDLEPDDDEWDTSAMETSPTGADVTTPASDDPQTAPPTSRVGELQLDDIDWNEINDEVEAAMNETDDDDEDEDDMKSEASVIQSDNETGTDTSRPPTPHRHGQPTTRKRLRSVTPNTVDLNLDENLRSPLSKRKRLAAERAGYSKLKEGTTAADLEAKGKGSVVAATPEATGEEEEDEEDDDDEGEEIDDDFLARELGEEWS
jgi:RNA polymerase II subunit A C-terminal domain phosphatase